MKTQNNVVIEVNNLYKIYSIGSNKVRALNGVSFTIDRGEFVAIVGTSGSGKSTLLNMLAGLEKPTKGEVIIAGEHIEEKSEANLVLFRQKHIGFIFQSYNLLPTMDAIENVELPLVFRGEDSIIRRKKSIKRLKQVGLANYLDHRPGQMSGGQQQRVGIARALVVDPEIIFADEPTGNLDSKTSLEVMNLMQNLSKKKNQTIVMVTHDNYLASFADKLIRIKDGKILELVDNRANQTKADQVKPGDEDTYNSHEGGDNHAVSGLFAEKGPEIENAVQENAVQENTVQENLVSDNSPGDCNTQNDSVDNTQI